MDSPFPGMDPYLEQSWGDFHHSLITYARDQLQPRLPRDLRAQIQERIVIEPPADRGEFYPDAHVAEVKRRPPGRAVATAVAEEVDVAVPRLVTVGRERRQGSIEIVDAGTRERVVTVIEILSPSNKRPGEGHDDYRRKLKKLKAGRVSAVEIDLLRAGKRGLAPARMPKAERTAYLACARRGGRPQIIEVYAMPLRARLPKIRIPLRQADADVVLDIQAIVDLAYDNGRYNTAIDYQVDPRPPLDPDDAAWADALLREKGRRS
jgi:hypothetical protein